MVLSIQIKINMLQEDTESKEADKREEKEVEMKSKREIKRKGW